MAVLFKGLNQGSVIYALFKGDELEYKEGIIVSVSAPRLDTAQGNNFPIQAATFNNVIDVTYSLDGKNFTEHLLRCNRWGENEPWQRKM